MSLETLQALVEQYGYLAIFWGTFWEGETAFMLGGIAAGNGVLDPWSVAWAALAGAFVGDQFFFLLGYWRGEWVASHWKGLHERVCSSRAMVHRHKVWLILLSRFLFGFRMAVPLACGTARVGWHVFLGLNLISAAAWTLAFGGVGYLFGGWAMQHMNLVAALPSVILLLAAVTALTIFMSVRLRQRLLEQRASDTDCVIPRRRR